MIKILYQMLQAADCKRKCCQKQLVRKFGWNTDGFSIFRSSNYNIWPFYITVNELSEHLRFQDPNMWLV